MKKKILFVSVNRHQKIYFATLCNYLEKDYEVKLIDYSLSHYFDTLLPIVKECPKELTQYLLDKIIHKAECMLPQEEQGYAPEQENEYDREDL